MIKSLIRPVIRAASTQHDVLALKSFLFGADALTVRKVSSVLTSSASPCKMWTRTPGSLGFTGVHQAMQGP